MATVDMDKVNKVYENGFHAVKDLSLDVREGEFMVLVGPSGCGKTTALRMVAGLEDITSGELRIGGKVVNDETPKERDIAMVFQNYALYPHMTVAENIGFALKLRKMPKTEIAAKVKETGEILGLTEWLDRKPGQLSGGQRQRVAMGRAIVRSPSVFLMDEPLSNLDAKLRVQMRAEVQRIQRRINVATLYVTHDQIEAMTMGDRVAVLRSGVLQQVDHPQTLYDHPDNVFVAAFIGSPAMNLYEATMSDDAQYGQGRVPDATAAGRSFRGPPRAASLRRQEGGPGGAARAPARRARRRPRADPGRQRGPGRGPRLGARGSLHHRRPPGTARGREHRRRGRDREGGRGRGPGRPGHQGQGGRADHVRGQHRGHAVLRHGDGPGDLGLTNHGLRLAPVTGRRPPGPFGKYRYLADTR